LWGHKFVSLELLEGHIRELIDALPPGVLACVVFLDFLQGFKENMESVLGFIIV
jgi:uncharacterized membrane protein